MRKRIAFLGLWLGFLSSSFAVAEETVNVYAWSSVIPPSVIRQFEAETGIKVNFSTYDSNETLYSRLRATPAPLYDVIEPSCYYVDRMRRQGLLEPIDKKALSQFHNLDPTFLNRSYDPGNRYSVPYVWSVTGIFFNRGKGTPPAPLHWSDLWKPEWHNQLMLLDDIREVFSVAMLSLGYSVNDENPQHIQKAYLKLRRLLPNVRIFRSDGVISLMADGDMNAGLAWNGDVVKARQHNPDLAFVLPKEGFVILADSFAIPKSAPHKTNALRFIDFMTRPDIAAKSSLASGYPTANLAARRKLPKAIRKNQVEYPPDAVLRRGEFQKDLSDSTLALYEKYWEKFRMGE